MWRCANRKNCNAILYTTTCSGNSGIYKEDEHSCKRDVIGNEIYKEFHNCKMRLKVDSSVTVADAYRETVRKLQESGLDVGDKIPDFKSVRDSLYRAKRMNNKQN